MSHKEIMRKVEGAVAEAIKSGKAPKDIAEIAVAVFLEEKRRDDDSEDYSYC